VDSITRKTMLYKSGLGFFCVNHVQGCSHGCLYPCYAYMMAHTYGRAKTYAEWRATQLVVHVRRLLTKDWNVRRKARNRNLSDGPTVSYSKAEVTDMS